MIRQLNPISWSQFNDGDAFVLNAVEDVFVWIGKKANKLEKFHAAKVCNIPRITDPRYYIFSRRFFSNAQLFNNCLKKHLKYA